MKASSIYSLGQLGLHTITADCRSTQLSTLLGTLWIRISLWAK